MGIKKIVKARNLAQAIQNGANFLEASEKLREQITQLEAEIPSLEQSIIDVAAANPNELIKLGNLKQTLIACVNKKTYFINQLQEIRGNLESDELKQELTDEIQLLKGNVV